MEHWNNGIVELWGIIPFFHLSKIPFPHFSIIPSFQSSPVRVLCCLLFKTTVMP